MLGLARASQYAGWWNSGNNFISRTSSTARYNGSWPAGIGLTSNTWNGPGTVGSGYSFSGTSLTSGAKGTQALVFKYQAQSNYTWTTDPFRVGFQSIQTDSSSSTSFLQLQSYNYRFPTTNNPSWPISIARTVTTNRLAYFGFYNGYDYVAAAGSPDFDLYADRWVAMVSSYSDTQSDFAGWSGTGSGSYFARICLLDAVTGEVLNTTDYRYSPFQGWPTDWANYTWSYSNTFNPPTGEARLTWVLAGINASNPGYDVTDILTAGGWHCQGQVIDPTATVSGVVLGTYFNTQNITETINGIRAWHNWSAEAVTTNGSSQELTRLMPGRVSQTSNIVGNNATSAMTSPYTSTDKP